VVSLPDLALDPLPGAALHEALDRLREQGSVARCHFGRQPAFAITTRAALEEAFRDLASLPPATLYQNTIARTLGENFQSMEGERHHLYRRITTPAFRSRAIERYGDAGMRELAFEVIDRFCDEREVDLVQAFTHRFPFLVISRLLGVPRDQEERFHQWAYEMLGPPGVPKSVSQRAAAQFEQTLAPAVEQRRVEPTGDVISELVHAESDGVRLTPEQISSHVKLMFSAGATTTCDGLGSLVYAVLTQGESLWKELVEHPALRPGAVHESLRWEPPVANLPRISAAHAVSVFGVELPPNSLVLMSMAASNRDPAAIEAPHRFDPTRPQADFLTFGRGERSCPGMHLGRKSISVALDALLERFPGLRLLGDPLASAPRGSTLRGPARLHVALRA
jgi:cytochrome P450